MLKNSVYRIQSNLFINQIRGLSTATFLTIYLKIIWVSSKDMKNEENVHEVKWLLKFGIFTKTYRST